MEGSTLNFIKLIYFDESFVADFIQIIAGGELKKTTEFITSASCGGNADASVSANVSSEKNGLSKLVSFLSGTTFSAGINGDITGSYTKDKVIKNILENTLLADFLDILKTDERRKEKNKKCKGIKIFDKVEVRPEPNSFTFFMLASPFLSMIDGEVPLENIDGTTMSINIKEIGDAINAGRGYYEFIGKCGENDVILRFNISAFRNNYTMSDLPKMQLTYYAIYVGETSRDKLAIQKEFEFGVDISSRITYGSDEDNIVRDNIKVYDVILAGVGD